MHTTKTFIFLFIFCTPFVADSNISPIRGDFIQKRYEKNRTLLHYAVKARDFELVSFLVREKISLLAQGGAFNNTALQDAISLGYLKIAYYLIKKGTPPNLKNRYGQTALHIASSRGYLGVIKLLLANGADKYLRDKNGHTPYELIPKLTHSSTKKLKELLRVEMNIKKKNYKESIFIDKKSRLNNTHIGIQIRKE
jgi:ankyrin repeat protein